MKRIINKLLAFLFWGFVISGCSDDIIEIDNDNLQWTEKTVAVILPMEKGLDSYWHRCLNLFETNFKRAFKSQDAGIKLNFEFYDESTSNLSELAEQLSFRDDVYAVIGGLYSSDAVALASPLTRTGKTFFTLATSEGLVRAYASSGNLWAMTETDITQCEVLLSKVVNYGGNSVALIAKENDVYGQTFIDWFAFQAKELGLENKGVFTYNASSLEDMARNAMQSGAEYVICVPSDIEDIAPMLRSYTVNPRESVLLPRLLFSDTAYGADVLSLYGDMAEGIEGVAFGADPESGFDVSYKTFFNVSPTTGEAQLYDAAMLIGYAAWYQYINPGVPLQKALRTIVSGEDLNMGSWTGEDMGLVVDAIASGGTPCVRGASGSLRFDSKIFTNVLATTYYNYKVYNGRYIILDYNTSDGGNRTDATLAGWNWKATQMQDFDDAGDVIAYPDYHSNWALLVASSCEWSNYRHQADVLAIYQQLKSSGYPDNRIILIVEDDIACNSSNPEPGVVRITPGGSNVYDNVEIDYHMSHLQAADVLRILSGFKTEKLSNVIEATENDNVFVFWSGHGVPGALCWNDNPYGITGDVLAATLREMSVNKSYRKLLMMVEACYSGGLIQQCESVPGMLFITAANGDETSKADIFNSSMRVWMSNRFTSTFIEQITDNTSVSMRDLYYRLFINTVGSHVMVYNSPFFGNLYKSDMSEFVKFKDQ